MYQAIHTDDMLEDIRRLEPISCGKDAAQHFAFEPGYRNLNHGSYGTYPTEVRDVLQKYQERTEARPDTFIRYEYRAHLLKEAREAIASYMKAPTDCCVLMPNTSHAIDTILLNNLRYQHGDTIICFCTAYGAFQHTLAYLAETTPVDIYRIDYTHPISDEALCDLFESALSEISSSGKRARLALFDAITSEPGVRVPFERLTEICRSRDVLSCIDAAHGVGDLELDLTALDPDFFVSNCHKWLYVPRGCAVLYVPRRNHCMLRASFPVSFDFKPAADGGKGDPPADNNYVANMSSIGTLDDTPYMCIPAAIEWRKKLTWNDQQGEAALRGYIRNLAREGGRAVASILGTAVLDNEEGTLGECNMTNVRLPIPSEMSSPAVRAWVMKTTNLKFDISVYPTFHAGVWWARLSAQVYLTLEDFQAAGQALKVVCERARDGEWKA